MSIPISIDPMGALGPVTELDSCGIAHNALVNTGLEGQVRNMRLVLHVGGVPLDGSIDMNHYVNVFGSSSGCRRYVRFGSSHVYEGRVAHVFAGSASDSNAWISPTLKSDMQIDVTYGTANVTAVINGQNYSSPRIDFTEPAGEVKMFFFSNLTSSVVFRFYNAKVYLNDELAADIVSAKRGSKIILWDKVRNMVLKPVNSPLLP